MDNMLGQDYTVQLFLMDLLETVREFLPYVLAGAITMGVITWVVGAVMSAVSMRGM